MTVSLRGSVLRNDLERHVEEPTREPLSGVSIFLAEKYPEPLSASWSRDLQFR